MRAGPVAAETWVNPHFRRLTHVATYVKQQQSGLTQFLRRGERTVAGVRDRDAHIQRLFANSPVDQFAYHVQVPDMPRILLQEMNQDPAKRGRIAVEPTTKPCPIS